ncbi:uncharacterized protein EAE97_007301 [Botrytis byssoidea]|uniref:Clr5 domain-containing protein n=1 Tax=Botrytis byssoidea TaxID=139641 RepID=A0A9P5M548_9HELO|nr:uncharacterized protein EAE97_007301 [Botrytis byssoidea]KAF7939221.1 hypothetical protein EAE97_007301 [Botrytis byssoidea]
MDYSKAFSIGDLKTPSTSAYTIDESKILESHCFTPERPTHHPHHGGKVITDADWPDLKSIIRRLYVIDNFTFLKVKEVLNLEFGYNITKRQFTRKVESWGFKKNFRRNERDEIVKSGRIPQRFIHDSRINQKRVERLQKRNAARIGLGVECEDNEESLVLDQDFSPKMNAIKEAALDLELCYTNIGHQNAALDDRDMIIEEIPRSKLRHDIVAPNTEEQWPFSQFAESDSRLSWLAELFVQLEIAETIASTSLETEKQWDVEEARFISGTALKELLDPYDNNLICGGSSQAQRYNHYPHHLSARSSSLQTHNLGMHQHHRSPLFEIDFSPSSRNSNNRTQNNLIHPFSSFERMSIDMEAKLSKLERVLPANSPAIVLTLESLAFVYHELNKSGEVAITCGKLLHARQKERSPSKHKIVQSHLWIVDSCIASGHLKTGMNLHNILHPRIENSVDFHHPLRIHSSYLMTKFLYQLYRNREAEDIIHPVMQVALVTLGHNHLLTIKLMNLLSLILRRKLCLLEADRLARYSLQVSSQLDLGATLFESARALMSVFEAQDLYKESIDLSHYISKFLIKVFGCSEHAHFVRHMAMVTTLLKQNEASKAVVRFKESVKLAVELHGWDSPILYESFKKIKESSIKRWIWDIEDSAYEIRGQTKEVDEISHGDDKHEAEGGNEAQYEGRELSLDDIFNAERDTSKDIGLEGLELDEDFLLKFKKRSEGLNGLPL